MQVQIKDENGNEYRLLSTPRSTWKCSRAHIFTTAKSDPNYDLNVHNLIEKLAFILEQKINFCFEGTCLRGTCGPSGSIPHPAHL